MVSASLKDRRISNFVTYWGHRFPTTDGLFTEISTSLPMEASAFLTLVPLQLEAENDGTLPVDVYRHAFWDLYRLERWVNDLMTKGNYQDEGISNAQFEEEDVFMRSILYLLITDVLETVKKPAMEEYLQNELEPYLPAALTNVD